MKDIYFEHRDLDEDGFDDAVCVYNRDFDIPLFGDYRGVEIARIRYIPGRPESVAYAERIANDLVVSQGGPDKNSIIGRKFLIETPIYEGFVTAIGVNNDDTVHVESEYGAIYIVKKDDLQEVESTAGQSRLANEKGR